MKKKGMLVERRIENAVILEKIDHFTELNREEHGVIIEQVKKTNGTVITNSNRISSLERWRSMIIGGLIVVNVIIVPILLWLFYEVIGILKTLSMLAAK